MNSKFPPQQIQSLINAAPHKFYCNGFITGTGAADVVLLLQQNNQVVASVNLSYTTAKSLAEKLAELMKKFEADTEHKIMTTDTIQTKLSDKK